MATTATRFDVTELAPLIGCAIRTDKDTLLSGEARGRNPRADGGARGGRLPADRA